MYKALSSDTPTHVLHTVVQYYKTTLICLWEDREMLEVHMGGARRERQLMKGAHPDV